MDVTFTNILGFFYVVLHILVIIITEFHNITYIKFVSL